MAERYLLVPVVHVEFGVRTAAITKAQRFWDVARCLLSFLVYIDPEDGGRKLFRKSVTICPLTLCHIAEKLNPELWFITVRISRLSLLNMVISCPRSGNPLLS
jgi:hypothetical protein